MNTNRALALGLLTTALLGGANSSLGAQQGCSKWCGCISTWTWGTRFTNDCPNQDNTCAYASCTDHREGCGYSDTNNDTCGSPDWCSLYQTCN